MTDAGKSFIIIHTIRAVWAKRKAAAAGKNPSPGVAQLVARLLWEDTPGQSHNFISGCCAVGSAPALGAGGPGFESPHSDQILQKNRLNRRFFCILSLIFVVLEIAVLRRFQWWKCGGHTNEDSRRNRQIPNLSLISATAVFMLQLSLSE